MMMIIIIITTILHSRYPAHKPRSDISEIKLNASYYCFDVYGRINYTDTTLSLMGLLLLYTVAGNYIPK